MLCGHEGKSKLVISLIASLALTVRLAFCAPSCIRCGVGRWECVCRVCTSEGDESCTDQDHGIVAVVHAGEGQGSISAPAHVCIWTGGKGVSLQIAFSECLRWLASSESEGRGDMARGMGVVWTLSAVFGVTGPEIPWQNDRPVISKRPSRLRLWIWAVPCEIRRCSDDDEYSNTTRKSMYLSDARRPINPEPSQASPFSACTVLYYLVCFATPQFEVCLRVRYGALNEGAYNLKCRVSCLSIDIALRPALLAQHHSPQEFPNGSPLCLPSIVKFQ